MVTLGIAGLTARCFSFEDVQVLSRLMQLGFSRLLPYRLAKTRTTYSIAARLGPPAPLPNSVSKTSYFTGITRL
jgi:hypothetical protein